VTERADLDPEAAFFRHGDATRLVYCTSDRVVAARAALGAAATVVDGGRPVRMRGVS
jgi:5-amino-6-(5-phosphoribosylamino)uracil reductase